MAKLLEQAKDNLTFLLISAGIVVILALGAKLVERFLPSVRRTSPTKRLCVIAVCGAIASILHILDFPLPFVPEFYKLDFSELPVMICGFYLGPSSAVACEAVKILLKLLLKGTSTAFVGDLANFVVGCSLVLPAAILYHLKKDRLGAVLGLAVGTVILTVFGSLFNAVYLLPKFSQLYGMPLDDIIALGTAINGNIHSVGTFVLLAVAPMNLIKGLSISILTLLIYKRIARPLFGK